jgi:hypothetical protein
VEEQMSHEPIKFVGDGDFVALESARSWLRSRGYSYGELQADAPTGIMHGDFDIAKWRNISTEDRAELDGVMNAPGRTYRTGPVFVELRRRLEEK